MFYPERYGSSVEIQSGTICCSEPSPLNELCTQHSGKELLRILQVAANQMEVVISILHGIPPL
jgi:hypothetical protein